MLLPRLTERGALPCRNYPRNAAQCAMSCRSVNDMMSFYEEPMVIVTLIGRRGTQMTVRALKAHKDQVILLRSACPLLAELVKQEANVSRRPAIGHHRHGPQGPRPCCSFATCSCRSTWRYVPNSWPAHLLASN